MPINPLHGRNRQTFHNEKGTGRTKQSFQFDADPNTLMKQFSKTGKQDLFDQTSQVAMHGDFSDVPDFFTALLQVQEVKEEYENLPMHVKRATHNSAMELFALLSDPEKIDQCIELGLIEENTTEAQNIPLTPDRVEDPSPIQGGESPPDETRTS